MYCCVFRMFLVSRFSTPTTVYLNINNTILLATLFDYASFRILILQIICSRLQNALFSNRIGTSSIATDKLFFKVRTDTLLCS